MAAGYFWSILFMLSMPFVLAGTYGALFYRVWRNAQRRQSSIESAESTSEPVKGPA